MWPPGRCRNESVEAALADVPPNSARTWIRLRSGNCGWGRSCVVLVFGIRLIVIARSFLCRHGLLELLCAPRDASVRADRVSRRRPRRPVHGNQRRSGDRRCGVGAGALERSRAETDHRRFPAAAQRFVRTRLAEPVYVAVATRPLGYGFTAVGATVSAGVGMMIWALVVSNNASSPTIRVDTAQSFRVDQ